MVKENTYFVQTPQPHYHTPQDGFYLMDDEWTFQATFTGAISQQIGLNLIHRRQGGPTGTAEKDNRTL